MLQSIKDTLNDIPQLPGVYMMKDAEDNIIYIGKAKKLKNRVKSYFVGTKNNTIKTHALVEHVKKIDWVVTGSEHEAFALEANLVKQFMPRYNILLKDDKHYPYVKINLKDEYPKIEIVRRVKRDGAKYYGPYFDATAMRKMVDAVNRTFKVRTCNKNIPKIKGKERPCLEYDIGRCVAPCLASVPKQEYRSIIYEVVDFMSGDVEKVQIDLENKMQKAAQEMKFELAAQYRDRLKGIEIAQNQGQRVIATSKEDFDLFAVYHDEISAVVQALVIRSGKVIGTENFSMDMPEGGESGEILEYFINNYYMNQNVVPLDIYISDLLPEKEDMESYLSELRDGPVHVHIPERGKKRQLLDMAKVNASQEIERAKLRSQRKYERTGGAVKSLKEELGLRKLPNRIEGFDISNIQGVDTVASMVVFEKGSPKKSDYRRFKIKTVEGPNDFKSMEEVIRRRFERLMKEAGEGGKGSFATIPDLVLIDGGKGQLASAREIMIELGYGGIDTIGLAKREEEVFVGDGHELVILDKRAPALQLLQRIRDEAHRFAITYHRSLRKKTSYRSVLDDIPGIGAKRKKSLLMAFPTVSAIKNADMDALAAVEGMGKDSAKAVFDYFNSGKEKGN
jgi:excinuclease ABC subunit C